MSNILNKIERPKKAHVMVNCNLKPEYQIKESDVNAWHFRGAKVLIDPKAPLYPIKTFRNICLRECDYDQFLRYANEEQKIRFWSAAAWHEVEMIHSMDLLPERQITPVDPEVYRENERKARQKAKLERAGLSFLDKGETNE